MASARVVDAAGPPWVRSLELAGAVAAIVVGVLLLPEHGDAAGVIGSMGIALLFARGLLRSHARARDAEITSEVGSLRIRGGPMRTQTVRARDVMAASVAPGPDGPSLAIVRRAAPERPLLVSFRTEGDLQLALRALAVRYTGFGEVRWRIGPGASAVPVLRVLLAATWLLLAACCAAAPAGLALQIAAWTLTITPLGLVVLALLVAFEPPAPHVALDSLRLEWREPSGVTSAVPCAALTDVRVDGRHIRLEGPHGSFALDVRGLRPDERIELAGHLRAAGRRGRDEASLPPAVSPSLGGLAPREESTRAWIERLDAAAAALRQRPAAYRGERLDEADLWQALESPDAPPVLRAAAARVLARAAPREAGVRVARVLAANRDAGVRGAIVGALEEDADDAARALEAARAR
ncbi:MAG TPA: hypothetical protein VKU41_25635 [Polyangiaceae bacterium]|nr:hypothetical protein [Polyangiaceae bacterium]